jgi:hypothetical protein
LPKKKLIQTGIFIKVENKKFRGVPLFAKPFPENLPFLQGEMGARQKGRIPNLNITK